MTCSPVPFQNRASSLAALSAALVITAASVLSPLAARAQEAAAPAVTESPAPAQPVPVQPAAVQPASPDAAPAGNVSPSSDKSTEAVQPPVAAPATPIAPTSDLDVPAAPADAPPADAQPEALEPAPSFLDDPAGAIGSLLDTPERDGSLPHDLSPWGMFMAADWVVKAVMIGLALGSLGVWTVWAAKTIELACAKARVKRGVAAIASASSLKEASKKLTGRGGPAAFMVRSAEDELHRSQPALTYAGNDGVKERLGARLARIEAQAGRRLSRGTGLLAIVGSTAPFIGLFGTVWGIMNSFIGISEANTTNLAVVAPGIAEALLATAIGLVAAIPAVIIYNVFARGIAGYSQLLADAASGVEQLVSLDLDLMKVPANDPGGPAVSSAHILTAAE